MTSLLFTHHVTAMGRYDRFTHNGIPYVPLSYDKHGYRFHRETDHRSELRLSHEEIYNALQEDKAQIDYAYYTKTETKLRHLIGDKTIADFSPHGIACRATIWLRSARQSG